MRAPPRARALGVVIALAAITACGGGDDPASTDVQSSGSESPAAESTPANDGTEPAGTDEARDTPDTEGSSGGERACDDIFDQTEMDEWFGEPAEMTEETTESLGWLACTWETIEDLADLDDLAASIVTAQVFSGDPVPAANFIDPDIFDEVTMLEGFGEVAFSTGELGQGFYFYDDPVAGTLNITDLDLGDADAPALHTADEVQALFRTFHERVTR